MNQVSYEQLKLSSRKNLFMFVCLSSKPNLGLTIKSFKFKHNNMFINKVINIRLDLTTYNITSLYVYYSKNILI